MKRAAELLYAILFIPMLIIGLILGLLFFGITVGWFKAQDFVGWLGE